MRDDTGIEGLSCGDVIAAKYRVERVIGRGSYGAVLEARHLQLQESVAIKVLLPDHDIAGASRHDRARFHREAVATATLRGPHVVRVIDTDFLPDGTPYLVMELVDGPSLFDYLHGLEREMPVQEAVDIAIEILAALGEAHAAGIVHRDLKTPNVMLARVANGRTAAKVLDFGLAKYVGEMSDMTQIATQTGALMGTVAYMAPEQMLDAKRVDARADLWALGVILYEMLSRALPFGPDSLKLVTVVLTEPFIPLSRVRSGVAPPLEAIIGRCLAKDPNDRHPSAGMLAEALAPYASARAAPALQELRRTGVPTGLAAPLPAVGDHTVRMHATGPPPPSSYIPPPLPPQPLPRMPYVQPEAPARSAWAMWVAIAVALFFLAGMAAVLARR